MQLKGSVRLDVLSLQVGLDPVTVLRWHQGGLVHAEQAPPMGRGRRPLLFSRPEAVAVALLSQLRELGVPLDLLIDAVRAVRKRGRGGKPFLVLGRRGGAHLADTIEVSRTLQEGKETIVIGDIRVAEAKIDNVMMDAAVVEYAQKIDAFLKELMDKGEVTSTRERRESRGRTREGEH